METRFAEHPTLDRPKHFDSKATVPDNKGFFDVCNGYQP
jgi:hypothetical protein